MMGLNKVFFEALVIAVVNVAAVYMGAFNYKLSWTGMVLLMAVVALLSGYLAHYFSVRNDMRLTNMMVSDSTGILTVAGLSSVAVLVILTMKYSLPSALGIALLSGGVAAFSRSIIRDM